MGSASTPSGAALTVSESGVLARLPGTGGHDRQKRRESARENEELQFASRGPGRHQQGRDSSEVSVKPALAVDESRRALCRSRMGNADPRASCCSLDKAKIGDAGAKSLADALKSNTTLTELE